MKLLAITLVLVCSLARADDLVLNLKSIPLSFYEESRCGNNETCFYFRSSNPIFYNGRIGFEYQPSVTFRESLRSSENLLYDVTYKINEFGFREGAPRKQEATDFAFFFGGSFTFGQGLKDEETLPSQFESMNHKYQAYNFGVSGAGMNTMMAQTMHLKLDEFVKEKSGIAVYIYFEEHIARALGNLPSLAWLRTSLYYREEDLQMMGQIQDARPLRTKVLLWMRKYVPGLSNRIFPSIGDGERNYACRFFERANSDLKTRMGRLKFVVLQHPFYGRMDQDLKSCLTEKGILVVDTDLIEDEKYKIPYDGHPNKAANQIISKLLSDALEK